MIKIKATGFEEAIFFRISLFLPIYFNRSSLPAKYLIEGNTSEVIFPPRV